LFASQLAHKFQPGRFVAFIVGTSLVIACGCVINNYIDRGLDKHMARTKHRSLVTGKIPLRRAVVYGIILGIIGFRLLLIFTNHLTALVGLIGLFFYLVMYSFWKRRSWLGTAVGSISGATPIAAGYTAVTSRFDTAALLLFLTLVFWQMPHFYAIAMYRAKDYRAAGLPVLPVKKGFRRTKLELLVYIVLFTASATSLTIWRHDTHYVYMGIMLVVGLYWLQEGIAGFNAPDNAKWARHMFFFSLIALLIFCVSLSVGAILP
jgi:heme o synthase